MTTATRTELKTAALRSLAAYLATGLAGFWVQGTDRLVALGIETARSFQTPAEIRHLIAHVTLYC